MPSEPRPTKRKAKLGPALEALSVPPGSVAIAWLGQMSFVLKSPGGIRIALDPYLSNSCEALGAPEGLNMRRLVPSPISPKELVGFDSLIFTHSHQDHVDPETIQPYLRAGGHGPYLAPHEASDRLQSLGVAADRIVLTWPNHTHQIGDLSIRATFAIPFAGDDLTHIGYLIEVRNGPKIYFTGDTDYNEILGISVAPHKPDIMVTVINGAFRNLSPREAARVAKEVNPHWVIPCHHDLFLDNSLPGQLLRTNLLLQGMKDTYCPLDHGVIRLFQRRPSEKFQGSVSEKKSKKSK